MEKNITNSTNHTTKKYNKVQTENIILISVVRITSFKYL